MHVRPLRSEINITPLVDVVLVLLIIFMILSPLLQSGYDVLIPDSQAGTSREPVIRVFLRASGNLYINDKRISRDALSPEVRGRLVLLYAEGDLPYSTVMDAMDRIHHAGASRIAVPAD